MSQKNFASYGDMETLLTEVSSKCGPYTEITYEEWLQLTPYQQEHGLWDVTGVPGVDGTISIDLMTKLWENPDPTQSFAAQNITLSSDDYDFLLGMCNTGQTTTLMISCIAKKGSGLSFTRTDTYNGVCNIWRNISYVDDTHLSVTNCMYNAAADNTKVIPVVIYGIKLHHTVKVKAIAATVSTLAKNCIFDPTDTDLESTNVEDAIKELETNFQAGVDDIYDAVVAKGSTPASHSLSDILTGIETIPTGITTAIYAGGNDIWQNGKNKTYSQSRSITLPTDYTKFLVFAASWGDGGAGAITLSSSGLVNSISRSGSNTRSRMAVGMYSKEKTSTLSVTASATSSTSGDSSCCCGLMLIACPVSDA